MVIKKIEHTAIIVKNLEESIEFYEKFLNFKVRTTVNTDKRKLGFLYVQNQPNVEIELIEELTDIKNPATNGVVDHLAFAVDNLEKTIEELESKGIEFPEPPRISAASGDKTIFFNGLNGELLQLIER
ncbi:VOC family protein [Lysinibacillus telephonicus]|uniref:VOC family protein n=1 Tax=Lysinibacillus telephonicus TaxID=1714840 RepID=A0A3S0HT80_9BACI|nr:VOC family protein [Lysinibacillus telephonicus]RTQ86377.1 VOC family protein [Lysinibacillus telephonicus]